MFFATLAALLSLTNAWQDGAGNLCTTSTPEAGIMEMKASKHGQGPERPMGFQVGVESDGLTTQVVVDGPNTFRGLLLYAVDSKGTKVGLFSPEGVGLGAKRGCDGPVGSILEHKSSAVKQVPLVIPWSTSQVPRGGNITLHAMIVQSAKKYETVKPFSFILGNKYTALPVDPGTLVDSSLVSFMEFAKGPAFFPMLWAILLGGSCMGLALAKHIETTDKRILPAAPGIPLAEPVNVAQ